jgi:hypothetical protein
MKVALNIHNASQSKTMIAYKKTQLIYFCFRMYDHFQQSQQSPLLMEETRAIEEKHLPTTQQCKFYYIKL